MSNLPKKYTKGIVSDLQIFSFRCLDLDKKYTQFNVWENGDVNRAYFMILDMKKAMVSFSNYELCYRASGHLWCWKQNFNGKIEERFHIKTWKVFSYQKRISK